MGVYVVSKPKALLEDLCAHVFACGAQSIEVEHKQGYETVSIRKDQTLVRVAKFASSGHDARELRENLDAGRKKPTKAAIGGQVWILNVTVNEGGGKNAFRVRIDPAPKLDPSVARCLQTNRDNIWRSFTTTRKSTESRLRNWTFRPTFGLPRHPFTR